MVRRLLQGRSVSGAMALIVLVALSTALRALAAENIPGPWIAPDEIVYSLLGRGLWQHGSLTILGGPTPYYSFLFPAFVGLPLTIGGTGFGYELLKVLQALVMSLAAVPVYLWGLSFMARRWALLAAALALAVPGLAYSGLVMTEVLFYPLLTLAAWAIANALVRPTLRAQALVVLALVAAAATRLQAIVLLPVFIGAIALYALLARSLQVVRRLWPSVAGITGVAGAWIAWHIAAGTPILGAYEGVGHISHGIGHTAKFILYHAASIELLTGVFPICALLVLLANALRHGEISAETRSYLAVVTSLLFCFVIEIGVFASEQVGLLAERYLLALAPILFLGFALWLARGGPRPYFVTSVIALAAAGPLLALPLKQIVVDAAPPDALTLIPFLRLRHATSLHTLETVFFLGVGVVVVIFALLPRRALPVLPVLLLAAGIAVSTEASTYVAEHARVEKAEFLSPEPRWVNRVADGSVAYVYAGEREWNRAWQTLFWNSRVNRVYDFGRSTLLGPVPQHPLTLGRDGVLTARNDSRPPVRYAVISSTFELDGSPIAQTQGIDVGQAGLRLWRYKPPLRLIYRTTGLLPNGDIYGGGDGAITAYTCARGGTFIVTLLIKSPGAIAVLRNGRLWRQLTFAAPTPATVWRGRIPAAPKPSGICALDIKPAGLTGTTAFVFQPGG
jgi:hypothetical protein